MRIRIDVFLRRRRQATTDGARDFVQIEQLGQIIEGATLGRADGGLQRIARAHDDHRHVGARLSDAGQNIQRITIREHDVGNQQVSGALLHPIPQRRDIAGHLHLMPKPCHRLM